ncbi:NAD(P)H-dependent flavin oxidoreductase, partial [Bacillus pumilus]
IVAAVKHAKKAEEAGADILAAEGFEAAGINSNLELTTFTLIPQICKQVSIPVLAAGGIGDGRGLAAALMLGASGVQLGTRLIATKDAPFHSAYKQRLMDANDHETVILGRTVGQVRRVLK